MRQLPTSRLFEGALEISTPRQILEGWDGRTLRLDDPEDFVAIIALANAALPDGHPTKITREWVRMIRTEGRERGEWGAEWGIVADALESYLPPEDV